MSEHKSPIPSRIYNAAVGGHICGTEDIIDDTKNKTQKQINSEVEESLGTGGSVDSRIASAVATETTRAQAAEADRYTKSETYTKEEVHNLITTPSQEYVSVTATAQTTAVTDVLPATGAADTTYRVGNWDGTQYNDSVFSEYAWDGSTYIKLSTKSQIGEVYDISANHADTKYADLAAALGTNGANVPQSLRKGGMSVKFVQTSDNNYIQARLMADSFTTDVTQWQGVDDTPTAGSNNLVKSGGVYEEVSQLDIKVSKISGGSYTPGMTLEQGSISDVSGGDISANNRIRTSNFIEADKIDITTSSGKVYVCGYKQDGTYIASQGWISSSQSVQIAGAEKYRLCFAKSDDTNLIPSDFNSLGISITALYNEVYARKEEVGSLKSQLAEAISLLKEKAKQTS